MTIATIRAAVNAQLDAYAIGMGENANLSVSDNVIVTDGTAQILETVNPTNNYPPVKK